MRTRSILSFILLLWLGGSFLLAQSPSEYIATEQPGYYIGVYTLAPGNVVVESQLSANAFIDGAQNFGVPVVFARVGVGDRFELRAGGGLDLIRFNDPFSGGTSTTLDSRPVFFELKTRLTRPDKEKGPHFALVTGIQPEVGNGRGLVLLPRVQLVTEIPVARRSALLINLATEFYGIANPAYKYGLAYDFMVAEHTHLFAEFFGQTIATNAGQYMESSAGIGIYHPFTPHLQGDISFGYSLSTFDLENPGSSLFGAIGFAFRIPAPRYK